MAQKRNRVQNRKNKKQKKIFKRYLIETFVINKYNM